MARPTACLTLWACLLATATSASAQTIELRPPIPLRKVTSELFKSDSASPPSFKGESFTGLDLSDLDFKKARLDGTDFLGADLSRANLKETSLTTARLDRAIITSTDFSGADLSGARIVRPTVFTSLEVVTSEAPRFTGAKLHGTIINGWLDRADFRAADMEGAILGNRSARDEIQLASRTSLISANFSNAILRNAVFAEANLRYAKFMNADLRGAILRDTDLTQAIFDGADLTGADLTGANIDEADFTGARGLQSMKGLAQTRNRETAKAAPAP